MTKYCKIQYLIKKAQNLTFKPKEYLNNCKILFINKYLNDTNFRISKIIKLSIYKNTTFSFVIHTLIFTQSSRTQLIALGVGRHRHLLQKIFTDNLTKTYSFIELGRKLQTRNAVAVKDFM